MTLQTSAVSPSIAEAIEVLARLETVRNVLAPDLNDQELQLFALVAQRSGLDPFAKQIYAVKRQGRVTFQTGIDGYRSVAERTREYDGSEEPVFGPIIDAPFPHPEYATVVVHRRRPDGTVRSQSATAWWSEFHPGEAQGHMWKKMPRNQLAKCAEALAMRKAFPYVLADVYITEEMDQAGPGDSAPLVEAAAKPTAAERIAARRQAIATIDAIPDPETPQEPPRAAEAEYVDTVTTPAFTEAEAPLAPTCGWSLQPKSGAAIPCTLSEMHAGEHSFVDEAIKTGGRVVRHES